MATLKKAANFPADLATEMFSKVKGHSSLAKLSAQDPISFNGTDVFVFNFTSDVSVVGESGAKPAGDASIAPVQIRPIKVVYQSRISDEFLYAAEERKLQYLKDFAEGFKTKIGAALDKMAMHGINPATGSSSTVIGDNHFDAVISSSNTITIGHNSTTIDANIEEAIEKVEGKEYAVTGIAMAPAARTAIANLTQNSGERKYPDFAFGAAPTNLGSGTLDVNATVSAASSLDRVLVGNFAEAFKWGYAKELPLEVIEYGDPDGAGHDLKQYNEVCLRSEAYIGWGILDKDAFALVKAANG